MLLLVDILSFVFKQPDTLTIDTNFRNIFA